MTAFRLDSPRKEWAEADIETLRRMWPDHSASQIAKIIGRSRNSVIGKAQRLRVDGKKPTPRAARLNRRRKEQKPTRSNLPRRTAPKEPVPPISEVDMAALVLGPAWLPLPGTNPVSLEDRTGCCWPVSPDRPYLFCNAPTGGAMWCPVHHARGYQRRVT